MDLEKAIDNLKDRKFLVEPFQFGQYSIIGVYDKDERNNLLDYQNMTYFVIDKKSGKSLVMDPGIRGMRRVYLVRGRLAIENPDVVISHLHIDHWIGYKPYEENRLYASQFCIEVLTGKRENIKAFSDGKQDYGHARPAPNRVLKDADRELPLDKRLFKPIDDLVTDFPIRFYELPGQTRGTVYGVMEVGKKKILFANDLFIKIKNKGIVIEPHYDYALTNEVRRNTILTLKAMMGIEYRIDRRNKIDQKNLKRLPRIRKELKKIIYPDLVLLGHGSFVMNTRNKNKIVKLIDKLEQLYALSNECEI